MVGVTTVRTLYALTEGTFGRGYRFSLRLIKAFLGNREAKVVFEDGSQFSFPIADAYWSRLAAPRFQYEPEIAHVMKWFKDVDYTFIDAGANYGFWSVLASSPTFRSKRAIAVEASAETFAVLERNCVLNARRFEIRHNAVFDKDDVELGLSSGHHTARHLTTESALETVCTVTLDTLAADAGIAPDSRVIIKLDVEGAEASALAGARRLLEGDTLLIYEDHGGDESHAITHHIRDELGLEVSYIEREGGVVPIDKTSRLTKIKTNHFVGYNFVASRPGTHFHRRLSSSI